MAKKSAGILVYRKRESYEVLLVHPGGPFYMKKDEGYWSVPKGEMEANEDPFTVALKEFTEETGSKLKPDLNYIPLPEIVNKSGKKVLVWAVEADFKRPYISSNTFELEWPPKSGKTVLFPEADRAEWFDLPTALIKIYPFQQSLLKDLEMLLSLSGTKRL